MKLKILIMMLVFVSAHAKAQNEMGSDINAPQKKVRWKQVFKDDFKKKGGFDEDKWSFCLPGNAAWAKYLTPSSDYAYQAGGKLILRMDDRSIDGNNDPYHSGGIKSHGKFGFKYGKIEVRAKFKHGQGSWPAIWMMPDSSVYGDWPNSGEIDIMEHLNRDSIVYQTLHSAGLTDSKGGSTASAKSPFKVNDFNVYSIEWTAQELRFYVNKTLGYTYKKPANATWKEWPFDQSFYIILNQSGGLGWPGPLTASDLPFLMEVDWVRVYKEK